MNAPNIDRKIVIQANELTEARYILTVGEQRLILAMISMISPSDSTFCPYIIGIKDLAQIVGADQKSAISQFDVITNRLMSRVLRIQQGEKILKTHWVSDVVLNKEEKTVQLFFSENLKPYLLQIKKQFTKVNFEVIVQFGSRYSVRIYQMLKRWEYKGEFEYELQEFREILGIKQEQYKEFKAFRQWVLNKAKKEFEKKTDKGSYKSDLSFNFKAIRQGRKIHALRFSIINQSYQEALPLHDIQDVQDMQNVHTLEDNEEIPEVEKFINSASPCSRNTAESAYKNDAVKANERLKSAKKYIIKLENKNKKVIGRGAIIGEFLRGKFDPTVQELEERKIEQEKKEKKEQEERKIGLGTTIDNIKKNTFPKITKKKEHDIKKMVKEAIERGDHGETTLKFFINKEWDSPITNGVFLMEVKKQYPPTEDDYMETAGKMGVDYRVLVEEMRRG